MNEYIIEARIKGTTIVEDPKCPSYWRGSGVYDIDVPIWCDVECFVFAESEEKALEMVSDYDYRDVGWDVDEVEIESCEFKGDVGDEYSDIEVFYGQEETRDMDYEPDPDDYYEERRLRER